ncbi:MAG: helix-hairpin-helix domain-containing protein, partial [Candidatus Thorarchaeota archaeon]
MGPKTGEKLVEAGFDSLAKVIVASAEDLASNVQGLSVAKAEVVIEAAKDLQEKIDSGELDITGKAKKSKRKKAQEPDPELHELPPAEV